MYDETIQNAVTFDLEQKVVSIANTNIALAAQGYVVNNNKKVKLDWNAILLHAFYHMDIFNEKQQNNIELLYNKISML